MGYFDTWLGFIGLLVGLVVAAWFGWRPLQTALAGYVGGVLLVVLLNVMSPEPSACLQNAKGSDILRAYKLC